MITINLVEAIAQLVIALGILLVALHFFAKPFGFNVLGAVKKQGGRLLRWAVRQFFRQTGRLLGWFFRNAWDLLVLLVQEIGAGIQKLWRAYRRRRAPRRPPIRFP